MTLALQTDSDAADLSALGIHRDTSTPDPVASAGFAQRLVNRISAALGRSTTSRRSFLTRTAVVGSALAVGPLDYILKPGTAYGYLCGTCSDGWTAFCCTVNNGVNACPAGSFVAGWWKADNAAYCCGSARYIIDCNAICPTQCSCRCGGGSCDNRRTCCNQFRYGQCHTEISCYGPVVCRVATCVVPWEYDPSCTTTSLTDNRTVNHGAPCLTTDCNDSGSAIARKYAALGGAGGILGAQTQGEHAVGDGRGRRARYAKGNIYWTSSTGAHEVHGGLLTAYDAAGGPTATIGYPTSDTRTSSNERWRYNNMERGRLYYDRQGTGQFWLANPIFARHEDLDGIYGQLAHPISNPRRTQDGRRVMYQNFARGRVYVLGGQAVEIYNPIFARHEALRGINSRLGYPDGRPRRSSDGHNTLYQNFDHGRIYVLDDVAVDIYDPVFTKHEDLNGVRGVLGYPDGRPRRSSDGRSVLYQNFAGGRIYELDGRAVEIHGTIFDWHENEVGGVRGRYGYPTTDLLSVPGGAEQKFEGGHAYLRTSSDDPIGLWGLILLRYALNGGPRNFIGMPTTTVVDAPGGRGTWARFDRGAILALDGGAPFQVHGAVWDFYQANGGPTGSFGYPTSELDPAGSARRFQRFENVRLEYLKATDSVVIAD